MSKSEYSTWSCEIKEQIRQQHPNWTDEQVQKYFSAAEDIFKKNGGKMKSEWKVSCNCVGGERMYIALRIRDVSRIKHSGNVETYGENSTDRESIQKLVDELNEKETNGS